MDRKLPAFFQHEWAIEDIRSTFFKCTTWQMEETMDPIQCPYHYICKSTYAGNYPPAVDLLVLVSMTASNIATVICIVLEMCRSTWKPLFHRLRRYLLPTGPVFLPIFLLALAKGHRINSIFPISCIGPYILQLIQVSALAFDNESEIDIKYVFFQASTISVILHASLYLDSIILPYYIGFDALVSSTFSGECSSCVCRRELLVMGGNMVSYRGWSKTTFVAVGTLCLRILCRLSAGDKTLLMKSMMETLSCILIITDSVYLTKNAPPEKPLSRSAAFAGLLVLILLHIIKKASSLLKQRRSSVNIEMQLLSKQKKETQLKCTNTKAFRV